METHGAREFLDSELDYIAEVLQEDSKNYHAWSYRQWLLMTVDEESVWENELEFGKAIYTPPKKNHCMYVPYA